MATPKTLAQELLAKLPAQQRKFVLAYCESFNATKSALAAGYAQKSARMQGCRLLTIDNIKSAVKAVLDTAGMDPEEIAARWDRIARADLADFYTKEEYQQPTKVTRPLLERIAELEYEYDFEERVAQRQNLDEAEWDKHHYRQRRRSNDLVRLRVELEMNPGATYQAEGPPETKYRLVLDLVKAAELGVLDLAKSIDDGSSRKGLTLRDVDSALDNLAKWRGMLVNKVDVTSGGEPVAQPPLLAMLSVEEKKRLLEARRQARAQEGTAHD